MKKLILFALLSLFTIASQAQNTRITDRNTIAWFAYTGTFKLDSKWGIQTEFQWRRDQFISEPQQNLWRTGINFAVNQKLSLRVGYALAETFSYGDIPLNNLGKQFTEHRTYQMATLSDKTGRFELSNRFVLEQRWIGRYSNIALEKEDQFLFSNRLRYMFRIQMPLKRNSTGNKTPYLAAYDELFLGFGKNVNENVFDQNRIGLLLGYRFSPKIRVEGGFINQTVQLSREINGSNVFQYNKGLILSTILNF